MRILTRLACGIGVPLLGVGFAVNVFAQPQEDFIEALLPEVSVTPKANNDEPFELSTGDFGLSLMYSNTDIRNMMQILEVFERTGMTPTEFAESGMVEDDDLLADLLATPEEVQAAKAEPPRPLPNFYVGTIMYHNSKNWSIWVNKKRVNSVTPEHDFGEDGLVKVSSISRQFVTLEWKPTDLKTAARAWKYREKRKQEGMKHRIAKRVKVDFNPEKGVFVATLRANQSFASSSMEIIEGRAPAPVAMGLEESASKVSRSGDDRSKWLKNSDDLRDGPLMTLERRAADEVIDETEKLEAVTPKRNRVQPKTEKPADPFVEDN